MKLVGAKEIGMWRRGIPSRDRNVKSSTNSLKQESGIFCKIAGMAGQSINDRLTAARYSLAGQGLAKSVCKATTEEVIGPKKKHLDCEYRRSRLQFVGAEGVSHILLRIGFEPRRDYPTSLNQ
ncbi:hypothetical protein Pcinc_035043 [Petrolisthes cinctipes]|uniref:Uncharacterized protein n=1 Tax=Petrolisthes cinctipes TaxID=88211 RepID=A0AAE1C1F1_PETCI|nr:hypothetical protein Pcinc_035043 [Petrolisthes cinctipes]